MHPTLLAGEASAACPAPVAGETDVWRESLLPPPAIFSRHDRRNSRHDRRNPRHDPRHDRRNSRRTERRDH